MALYVQKNTAATVKIQTLDEVDFYKELNKILEEVVKKCAKEIKKRSPSGTGKYANGWTYSLTSGTGTVFNNGKHKSLSHLLELGHRTKDGGTVAPQPHIYPAAGIYDDLFLKKVKEAGINLMDYYSNKKL